MVVEVAELENEVVVLPMLCPDILDGGFRQNDFRRIAFSNTNKGAENLSHPSIRNLLAVHHVHHIFDPRNVVKLESKSGVPFLLGFPRLRLLEVPVCFVFLGVVFFIIVNADVRYG